MMSKPWKRKFTRKNLKLLLARLEGLDVCVKRNNLKKKKERKAIWL